MTQDTLKYRRMRRTDPLRSLEQDRGGVTRALSQRLPPALPGIINGRGVDCTANSALIRGRRRLTTLALRRRRPVLSQWRLIKVSR